MRAILFILLAVSLIATPSFAHQPRVVFDTENSASSPVLIEDPEISKAYYGILDGNPDYYSLESDTDFILYLNILVPDLPDSRTDYDVVVLLSDIEVARLFGQSFDWQPYFEVFARDDYIRGPEYESIMPPGNYTIIVSNPDNLGKYSLAVGKIESFPLGETIRTLITLPRIKSVFFEKSPLSAFANIFGLIALLVLFVIFALAYILMRRYNSKYSDMNN